MNWLFVWLLIGLVTMCTVHSRPSLRRFFNTVWDNVAGVVFWPLVFVLLVVP